MEPVIRRKVVTASVVLSGLLFVSIVLMVVVARSGLGTDSAGPSSPPPEVEAYTLHADYAHNVAAADEKYRNRRLRIRGQVLAVEPISGKYAVGLFATPKLMTGGGFQEPGAGYDRINAAIAKAEAERDNPKDVEPGVVAIFAHQSEVAKLRNGDALVIEGICSGREEARGRKRGLWVVIEYATVSR